MATVTESFEDIFKSTKKGAAPAPAAAQKKASRIGNESEPTRGGQKKGQVGSSRGGAKQKTDVQMGGRPKKDPTTEKSEKPTLRKAFPVVEGNYNAVQYIMDSDPAAPKSK